MKTTGSKKSANDAPHITTVERDPKREKLSTARRANCSCGWRGPVRVAVDVGMELAANDAIEHEAAERAASVRRIAVIVIEVTNCLDCMHAKRVSDPGSDDSFNASDESLCCRLVSAVKGDRTNRGEKYPGRIIVACERSESEMRRQAAVPEWCPLVVKDAK